MSYATLDEKTATYERVARANAFVATAGVAPALHATLSDVEIAIDRAPWLRPYVRKKAVNSFDPSFQPVSPTAFLELLGEGSVSGRIIPLFQNVPMNTPLAIVGSGSEAASIVGEGDPIPVANFTGDTSALTPAKVSIIAVYPSDLARDLQPRGVAVVNRGLISVVGRGVDLALFDPANPESLAAGATVVSSTGSSAAQIETDVFSVITTLSGGAPQRPILVLSRGAALRLAKLRSSGVRVFPDVAIEGLGSAAGVPAYVVPSLSGDLVIGIDAASIAIADDGIELGSGAHATVTTTDSPAETIALWQMNAISIRAVRLLAWEAASADSVTLLTLP